MKHIIKEISYFYGPVPLDPNAFCYTPTIVAYCGSVTSLVPTNSPSSAAHEFTTSRYAINCCPTCAEAVDLEYENWVNYTLKSGT